MCAPLSNKTRAGLAVFIGILTCIPFAWMSGVMLSKPEQYALEMCGLAFIIGVVCGIWFWNQIRE